MTKGPDGRLAERARIRKEMLQQEIDRTVRRRWRKALAITAAVALVAAVLVLIAR